MRAGKYHLQSVQLVGFVLYSHYTINVGKEEGRTERADDVEWVPAALTEGLYVVKESLSQMVSLSPESVLLSSSASDQETRKLHAGSYTWFPLSARQLHFPPQSAAASRASSQC